MGNVVIGAIAGTVVQLGGEIARFLFHALLVVAFALLLATVLPADPFQPAIIRICSTFRQWSGIISYFLPIRFIISSWLFTVVFRYFYYVYSVFMAHWDMLKQA